jgi:hypothetical protein
MLSLSPPAYDPPLVVALDFIHNSARRPSHGSSPGTYYGSNRAANNCASGRPNSRAGRLLPGGTSASQETEGCNKRELLHELSPTSLIPGHPYNSSTAGQFGRRTEEKGKTPQDWLDEFRSRCFPPILPKISDCFCRSENRRAHTDGQRWRSEAERLQANPR